HLPFNILPASSGLLVYEISGQAQINQMIVTDASGKILMSLNIDEENFIGTVDVSQLSKGLYYISTTDVLMGRVTKEFFVL
ncbi:MAG: T9SS type A sorting domain-containing protein, partial [Saprospiraceae bacterium]|nr:T9SS type A sorting domain-containing protein [Saprospiraceae bacterium]